MKSVIKIRQVRVRNLSIEYIESFKTIFWDFDGVIKDSVDVKSDAFKQLFLPFGKDMANRIKEHHLANCGMSRFDKFPIYLEWTGQLCTDKLIEEYSNKFSSLVKQKVIESNWVLGILDYFKNNSFTQTFFLITATPQQEIEEIMRNLKIENYFEQIVGSPTKKADAIKTLLNKYAITTEQALMIGDSNIDYEAALTNRLPFVLRKTNLNKNLQKTLNCFMITDYS